MRAQNNEGRDVRLVVWLTLNMVVANMFLDTFHPYWGLSVVDWEGSRLAVMGCQRAVNQVADICMCTVAGMYAYVIACRQNKSMVFLATPL